MPREGGAVGVLVFNMTTLAFTGSGVTIRAGNNGLISASDDTKVISVTGGAAGGFVGVGVGIQVLSMTKDTEASVGANNSLDFAATQGSALGGISAASSRRAARRQPAKSVGPLKVISCVKDVAGFLAGSRSNVAGSEVMSGHLALPYRGVICSLFVPIKPLERHEPQRDQAGADHRRPRAARGRAFLRRHCPGPAGPEPVTSTIVSIERTSAP